MLIIENGKVLTMAGKEYENGSVVIQDGRIDKVLPGQASKELSHEEVCSAQILDAQGGWIMPGIIEAHCHMGITEEKKGVEGDDCNETVNPVTPTLRAMDAINPMDAAFAEAVRAGITSAMIGPGSSNVVGGQFAFVKTKGRCVDEMTVLSPAAMKVAFGENPKSNYSGQNQSPVTRMAIADLLREELFEARAYLENDKRQPEYRYECWRPVFEHKIPLKAHVHRVDDIFTAVRIAKEFGLDMTLDHCSEGHLIAEQIAQTGFPAIVGPDLASRNKIEVQNMAFKTAGILERAGVPVAITTDHPVSLIQSLPLCAGLAVKAGLSMEAGLKAITIQAAEICRVDQRVGSLEVGKDADVAVFTDNPMKTFTKTMYTVIDGKICYDYRTEKK
ncbi:MAG: amidohydrolase [Clostridiales bacterium]|nr:amidohydrolase [Clostridiales bacterium]